MTTSFDTFVRAKDGVSVEQVRATSDALGISLKELAQLLDFAESTLHRKLKSQEPITERAAAEQLIELDSLAKHGYSVFSNPKQFTDWLRQPQWDLDDELPITFLTTISGIKVIDNILGRIEHNLPA